MQNQKNPYPLKSFRSPFDRSIYYGDRKTAKRTGAQVRGPILYQLVKSVSPC